MRIASLLFAALSFLLVLSGGASAGPPLRAAASVGCVSGLPSVTVSVTSGWGFFGQVYFHNPSASPGPLMTTQTQTFPVASGSYQLSSLPAPGQGTLSPVYSFTMPVCASTKKGMTWVYGTIYLSRNTLTVGCGSLPAVQRCNPYHGDTLCTLPRPVLCAMRPATPYPPPFGLDNSDPYNKWAGEDVAATTAVPGTNFANLSDADAYCQVVFGSSAWHVAEFHDGIGGTGWNFQAFGSPKAIIAARFWVNVKDQPDGNCWKQ